MQKITPFLWFNDNAEEALHFYAETFRNARILDLNRGPNGKLFTGSIEIEGMKFAVINGGPIYTFTEAVSFVISCKDQDEIDDLWDALIEDGGEEGQCGWLKDKFGLSWQVVPERFMELMSSDDSEKTGKVMDAMMQMKKFIISDLEKAFDGQ